MAHGIQNYTNPTPPDTDYPDGNIKDNTGTNDGTPVDQKTYTDMHQTLAKMMRMVELAPNGLPDNEYNGFQYLNSLFKITGGGSRQIIVRTGSFGGIPVETDNNPIVVVREDAGAGCFISLDSPTGYYKGTITILNYSANTFELQNTTATNINGVLPPFNLLAGDALELEYEPGGGGNFAITKLYKLDI